MSRAGGWWGGVRCTNAAIRDGEPDGKTRPYREADGRREGTGGRRKAADVEQEQLQGGVSNGAGRRC